MNALYGVFLFAGVIAFISWIITGVYWLVTLVLTKFKSKKSKYKPYLKPLHSFLLSQGSFVFALIFVLSSSIVYIPTEELYIKAQSAKVYKIGSDSPSHTLEKFSRVEVKMNTYKDGTFEFGKGYLIKKEDLFESNDPELVAYQKSIEDQNRWSNDPKKALQIKSFSWKLGGFGTVALINNARVFNKANFPIKDFTIEMELSASSGTILGKVTKKIYQTIPAKGAINTGELSMGFINGQASSASLKITDALKAN